jgi:dTMP kinase
VRGRFIALEGGDGSGKSTQAARLAGAFDALVTREPGGTAVGAIIRDIVLDPTNAQLTDRTEALLYAADRAQHAAEIIEPALAAGRHVVSDRSAWSSVAYQGYGRGMDPAEIRRLSEWAVEGVWPDLVVLLDVDPMIATARRTRDRDRLELVDEAFRDRVRKGFLTLATADPQRWIVVDGGRDEDAVAAAARRAVTERLGL